MDGNVVRGPMAQKTAVQASPRHRYRQLVRSAPGGAYFAMCAVIFVISSFIGGPQQCGAIGWKTISPVHFGFVALDRKSLRRCTPSFR